LKEGDIQWVLSCHAAELTEKGLEQVTSLCEAGGEEDFDAVVERHQLTASVLKKGLQIADYLVIFLK
jgi:broad specificity phosphatase PhoE